jgi:hypothetical protein
MAGRALIDVAQTAGACADVVNRADDAVAYLLKANFDGVDTAGLGTWPWRVAVNHDPTILLVYIVVPLLASGLGWYASRRIFNERGRQLAGDGV